MLYASDYVPVAMTRKRSPYPYPTPNNVSKQGEVTRNENISWHHRLFGIRFRPNMNSPTFHPSKPAHQPPSFPKLPPSTNSSTTSSSNSNNKKSKIMKSFRVQSRGTDASSSRAQEPMTRKLLGGIDTVVCPVVPQNPAWN